LSNEYLARRIGKMLLGPNDVRDPHITVIDDVGKVVQTRAIRALDDMVLLMNPFDDHVTANMILEIACAFARHLKPDNPRSPLTFKLCSLGRCFGHPATAVEKRPFLFFRGRAFGFYFLWRRIIVVGKPFADQGLCCFLIPREFLRLVVGTVWAAYFSPLVPVY